MKGTYVFLSLILLVLLKWVLYPFYLTLSLNAKKLIITFFCLLQIAISVIAMIDNLHEKDFKKSDAFVLTKFSIPAWIVYFTYHAWDSKGKQVWLKLSKFLDKYLSI